MGDSNDEGTNLNYFLVLNPGYYRLISPADNGFTQETRVLNIGVRGRIDHYGVNYDNGGVQFLGLCYGLVKDRGWVSSEEEYTNFNNYLEIGITFLFISPSSNGEFNVSGISRAAVLCFYGKESVIGFRQVMHYIPPNDGGVL